MEATFAALLELAGSLDAEQCRAVEEGLSETELALIDLLFEPSLGRAKRERLKQASKALLASLRESLASIQDWTRNATTQGEVRSRIVDTLQSELPMPPIDEKSADRVAVRIYDYVLERSAGGPGVDGGLSG